MASRRLKFAAVVVFALVGVLLAARTLLPGSPRSGGAAEQRRDAIADAGTPTGASAPPTAEPWFVAAERDGRHVTSDEGSLEAVIAEATVSSRRALERIPFGTGLDADRGAAIVESFTERLRLHLNPDFDAHQALIARLGGSTPYLAGAENADRYRAAFEDQRGAFAFAPLAPGDVRIRARYVRGARIPTDDTDGLPMMEVRHPSMFALAGSGENAERRRLDVYEVLIPMAVERTPGAGGGRAAGAVGYGFVWDEDRRAWTPWAVWVYGVGTDAYPPNFP